MLPRKIISFIKPWRLIAKKENVVMILFLVASFSIVLNVYIIRQQTVPRPVSAGVRSPSESEYRGDCFHCFVNYYNTKVSDDKKRDFVCARSLTNIFMNPNDFDYVISNSEICKVRTPKVVIGVQVSPSDRYQRDIARLTWANSRTLEEQNALVIFFLGLSTNQTLMADIRQESRLFADVVVDGFIDDFHNLSLKAVSMFKWVTSYCRDARYFIHVDGDTFVNVDHVVHYHISKHRGPEELHLHAMSCLRFKHIKVVRNLTNKYYMPYSQFVPEIYPTYCSGCGYITDVKTVTKLFKASINSGYIWLSDVFVTGLLAAKIDMRLIHISLKRFWYHRRPTDGNIRLDTALFVCNRTPQQIIDIWNEINNGTKI